MQGGNGFGFNENIGFFAGLDIGGTGPGMSAVGGSSPASNVWPTVNSNSVPGGNQQQQSQQQPLSSSSGGGAAVGDVHCAICKTTWVMPEAHIGLSPKCGVEVVDGLPSISDGPQFQSPQLFDAGKSGQFWQGGGVGSGQLFGGCQLFPDRQQFDSGQPVGAGQPLQNQMFNSVSPFTGGQLSQSESHLNGQQSFSADVHSIQQPPPCVTSTQFVGALQLPGANQWPPVQLATLQNHAFVSAISQQAATQPVWAMGSCSSGQGMMSCSNPLGDLAVAAGPLCTCGLPSNQYTVKKDGLNKGRFFFKCCKPIGEQCHYFQWADEPIQAAAPGAMNGTDAPVVQGPPCECGVPSNQFTVRKEGPNTGRQYFGCGRQQGGRCNYFQWADEPAPQPGQGGNNVGGQAATGPPCSCGTPSIQLTVRKEGPNTGRMFYKCSKPQGQGQCNYFQWADEPIQALGTGSNGGCPPAVAGPLCQCGQSSVQLTVRKEGPNTGRLFFGCARQQGERCNYFQWADEVVQGGMSAPQGDGGANFGGPSVVAASGPSCICGQPSTQLTVRKEGSNIGRKFYKCSRPQGQGCDYFQWSDESISSSPRANNAGSKGQGRGRCGGRGRGRGKNKGELAEDFMGGSGAASGDDGFALETNKHGSVNHRFEPY